MNITPELKDKIIDAIKTSPAYKGRDDLLEDFYQETLINSQNLIQQNTNITNIDIYVKKIATNSIIKVLSGNASVSEKKADSQSKKLSFEVGEDGKVLYDIEIPDAIGQSTQLSPENIDKIKKLITELDKNNKEQNYKQLFEMRYLKRLSIKETAEKLGLEVDEASRKLVFILSEINNLNG